MKLDWGLLEREEKKPIVRYSHTTFGHKRPVYGKEKPIQEVRGTFEPKLNWSPLEKREPLDWNYLGEEIKKVGKRAWETAKEPFVATGKAIVEEYKRPMEERIELLKKAPRISKPTPMQEELPTGAGFIAKETLKGIREFPPIKGIEYTIKSAPQVVGSLIQEFGERMEEEPTFWDFSPNFAGSYLGKKILAKIAKKSEVDERIAKMGKDIIKKNEKYIKEQKLLPTPRDSKIDKFLFNLGSGVATLGTAVGLSLVTKSPHAAALAFGVYAKGQTYKEARKAGVKPEKAGKLATVAGVVEGGLEYIGLSFLLKRYGGRLLSMVVRSGTEAVQEFSQELGQNIVAKIGWDKTRNLLQGTGEAALIGAILGAPTSVVISMVEKSQATEIIRETGIDPKSKTGKDFVKRIIETQRKGLVTEMQEITSKELLADIEKAKEKPIEPTEAQRERMAMPEITKGIVKPKEVPAEKPETEWAKGEGFVQPEKDGTFYKGVQDKPFEKLGDEYIGGDMPSGTLPIPPENVRISDRLGVLSKYYQEIGDIRRTKAYIRASMELRKQTSSVKGITQKDLMALPGIGKSIAKDIKMMIDMHEIQVKEYIFKRVNAQREERANRVWKEDKGIELPKLKDELGKEYYTKDEGLLTDIVWYDRQLEKGFRRMQKFKTSIVNRIKNVYKTETDKIKRKNLYSLNTLRNIYWDLDELAGSIEYHTGKLGVYNKGLTVRKSYKKYGSILAQFRNQLEKLKVDFKDIPIDQNQKVHEYLSTGIRPEGMNDKWATATEFFIEVDKWRKPMVIEERIRNYIQTGRISALTKDQLVYVKNLNKAYKLRNLYKDNPAHYEQLLSQISKLPESDILVRQSYHPERGETPIESMQIMDIDIRESYEYPATMSKYPLHKREKGAKFNPETDNALLQQYSHTIRIFKLRYLRQPVNKFWQSIQDVVDLPSKQRIKDQLQNICGMGKYPTDLEIASRRAMGNLFKVISPGLIPKNWFQKYLNKTAIKKVSGDITKIRTRAFMARTRFKKMFGEDMWKVVQEQIIQRRAIAKELFAKNFWGRYELKGVLPRTIGFLTNNALIRLQNKLLTDRFADMFMYLDTVNRLDGMSTWLQIGNKWLNAEKPVPWKRVKKHLGFRELLPFERNHISRLVAQGKTREAIFDLASMHTKINQYEYDTVIRNIYSQSAMGRVIMHMSTWWRNFTKKNYRIVYNAVHNPVKYGIAGVGSIFTMVMAKAIGDIVVESMYGRLEEGDTPEERIANTLKETFNPLSYRGVFGASTMINPWSQFGDSYIIQSLKIMKQTTESLGKAVVNSKNPDEFKKNVRNISEGLNKYGEMYYFVYRKFIDGLNALEDYQHANAMRMLAKEIFGVSYNPNIMKSTTAQKWGYFLFSKHPYKKR